MIEKKTGELLMLFATNITINEVKLRLFFVLMSIIYRCVELILNQKRSQNNRRKPAREERLQLNIAQDCFLLRVSCDLTVGSFFVSQKTMGVSRAFRPGDQVEN